MSQKKSLFRRAWKKFWDIILGASIIQWIVAVIIAMPIWFIFLTSVVKIKNYETLKKYRKKPAIFVFWHGRSMMLSPLVTICGVRGYIIASQHHDGRIMARVQRLFGLRPLYGSTSHGGASVLRGGVRVLMDGRYSLCISPDGPGGPSMRIKDGALYFSKMTGAPIIPVTYSASRAKFVKRWDRFLLVKPFSRINCVVGEPVWVPRRASEEEFESVRKSLEDYMVEMAHKMDAEFNYKPVEQDMTAGAFKDAMRAERAAKRNKNRGQI